MSKTFLLTIFVIFISCNNTNKKDKEKGEHRDSIITKSADAPKILNLDGEWNRASTFENATLTITNSAKDSFNFSISALSGGHTGDLEGVAKVKDNIAFFTDTAEFTSCKLQFQLTKDSIIIIESDGTCGAGMGVVYGGAYYYTPALSKEDNSFNDMNVLEDARANGLLKKITGKYYKLFQESSQLIDTEEENFDGPGIKVQSAGVRGLFTIMENIVMVDNNGHIWAAVIDGQKVRYFTNAVSDKNKLPKTIEKWRERFKEYKVLYEK